MPLTSFRVENQKAVRLAECRAVPPIMLIAGPNGVGKSTLLYSIWRRQGATVHMTGRPLYVGPHRSWRRQQLRLMHLWGAPRSYSDILQGESVQGPEGIRITDSSRTPYSSDEAMSLLKYTLAQLETRRQTAVTASVDRNELVYPTGKVPDVYGPLKELTTSLLPHLEFSRVDVSERDNVKCLWKRASGVDLSYGVSGEVDIDELSSGEKAVVSLFLPFIETQVEARLNQLEGKTAAAQQQDLVVLIDEPELHLHPALQARMLNYLRAAVTRGGVQFIITTHSTSLLNGATFEELFVLTPKPAWPDSANQLIQLVDDAERLEALRMLCGETYPATACRNIVCLEGELPEDRPSAPTDKRILEILCPDVASLVTIPMGGRNEVIGGARRLREVLPSNIPGLNVFALVDRDQANGSVDGNNDWVFTLPVCMLENLLIEPEAIWKFLEPYREQIALKSAPEVEAALRGIAKSLREDEIRLRVGKRLKLLRFDLSAATVADVKSRHESLLDELRGALPKEEELSRIVSEATSEVDGILQRGDELKAFRGKHILDRFRSDYLTPLGSSSRVLWVELAREIARREESVKPLRSLVSHVHGYIPVATPTHIAAVRGVLATVEMPDDKRKELVARLDAVEATAKRSLQERAEGKPAAEDRSKLRAELLNLGRAIEVTVSNGQDTQIALRDLRNTALKIGSPYNGVKGA